MRRGGKRTRAGRPQGTGRFGEPTKPIRVPVSDLCVPFPGKESLSFFLILRLFA